MIFMLYWEDIQLEVGKDKCSDSVTISYNITKSDDTTSLFNQTLCGFLDGIVFSEEKGRANPAQGFKRQEFVLTNEFTVDFKSDSFGHYKACSFSILPDLFRLYYKNFKRTDKKGFLLRIEAIPMNIYYARQKDFGQLDIAKFDSRLKFCGDEGRVSNF